jgi:hypothetical protein
LSNPSVAQPTFRAPGVDPQGETLTFQLTVTDSAGLVARDSCIVNVVWVNQPPVANAGPDQNVNERVSVSLNGTGSTDPDGGIVAYSWLQTSGSPVTLDNPGSAQPRFVAPAGGSSGSLVFRLTVTDPEGLSGSDQCSVVVSSASSDEVSEAGSGPDLSGQWLSLSRTAKWWKTTFRGKIRVRNLGGLPAPSSALHVYQSADSSFQTTDRLLGKIKVSSIPAGGYVDVNVDLSAPYSRTKVYLIGILDPANAIVEVDDTNNNRVVSGLL